VRLGGSPHERFELPRQYPEAAYSKRSSSSQASLLGDFYVHAPELTPRQRYLFQQSSKEGFNMQMTRRPISLAGSQLRELRHVCAFFSSDDEEYKVLLPFIKDGLECGDKAVHLVNPHQHVEHLHRLASAGIDPTAAQRTGQLDVKINTEVYLREGKFDQDRMLQTFEQLASGNAEGGFPLSRIVCRMDWEGRGSVSSTRRDRIRIARK
jgi:hypothetical protein